MFEDLVQVFKHRLRFFTSQTEPIAWSKGVFQI